MTREEISRAKVLAGEGKSYRQIARELGVLPLQVWEALGDNGEESSFARMARMSREGMTNAEIGRSLGLSRQAVAKELGARPCRPRTVVRTIRVEPRTWEITRDMAQALGLRAGRGPKPSGGSVGLLLDAIARGDVEVTRKTGGGSKVRVNRGD